MNFQPPYDYDFINLYGNIGAPSAIHPFSNMTSRFYLDYFLKRAMSKFTFQMPEEWQRNFFYYVLFIQGYIAIFETKDYGIIPMNCTLSGFGLWYQPRDCIISNPALNNKGNGTKKLGSEAELVLLQPNYKGIWDICALFAERMAYAHEALVMNLAESKLSHVFFADNKAQAQMFKAMMDEVQQGNFAVAVGSRAAKDTDGHAKWDYFLNNLKQNYIATDILQDMRTITNDFDSFIGIPSTNTAKKARLNVDEVNANNVETETLADVMFDTLTDSIERVKKLFPDLQLSVEKNYDNGGEDDGTPVDSGSVSVQ